MRTAGSWITNGTPTWGGEVAGKLEYHNNRWYASVNTAFVVRSTAGSEVLWAYNTGVVEASNDFRAPIFYDSINTGYYVNPNSDSVLANVLLASTIDSALYYDTALEIRERSFAGAQTTSLNNAPRLSFHWGGRVASQLVLDSANILNVMNGDCTGWTTFRAGDISGNIFIDRENTAYYADPNGTSALSTVTYGSNPNSGGGGGRVIPSTGSPYSLRQEFGSDNTGWRYGIAKNVSGTATIQFYVQDNGTAAATGDFRAPIFYDSDNTNYYLDPASSSVLGAVSLFSTNDAQLILNGNGSSWAGITFTDVAGTDYMFYNGSGSTFAIGGGGSNVANKKLHVHGGMTIGSGIAASSSGVNNLLVESAITSNQMYSQIFYDSNDTGYYIDPNSTADTALRMRGGALFGPNASWSAYLLVGGNGRGGYVDSTTVASVSTTNGNLHLDSASGFDTYINYYDGTNLFVGAGNSSTVRFAVYGSSDYSIASGSMRAPIFYDSDNTAFYINPNSTSQVSGANFNFGSTGRIYDDGNFHIDGLSSPVWINSIGNSTIELNTQTSGYVNIGNSGRAPLFYDSNNTAFFLDPASTSNLDIIRTYIGARDTNGNWATGFQNTPVSSKSFHGDIASGGPAGTWWFYESMRHSNASNYWGTQIAWGWEDNSNRLFQRNVSGNSFSGWVEYLNTGDRTFSGNLNMTGIIRSTASDMRAPIFYDQNDTGWYCDPNSTSKFVNVGIQTPPSAGSYLNIGGNNNYGGTGYNGFLTIFNSYGSASNPYQYWRLNSAGGFEIVNSAYNAVLFTFTQGGDFTAAGNVTAYSDRKIKDNFEPITNALNKVLQLNGVTFTRIDKEDTTKRYGGLVAQDVEAVLPEAVNINETMSYGEVMSVDYNATIALLVEAIKEQQTRINTLEQQIISLKEDK
jgi:hypothetical protein